MIHNLDAAEELLLFNN